VGVGDGSLRPLVGLVLLHRHKLHLRTTLVRHFVEGVALEHGGVGDALTEASKSLTPYLVVHRDDYHGRASSG
jgi:hypothetical protein